MKHKLLFSGFALSAVTNFIALAVNLRSIAKAERLAKDDSNAAKAARGSGIF